MIKIKFSKRDKHYLEFSDCGAIVRFLRSQALPWRSCKKGNNSQRYKAEVASRAKKMYGCNTIIRELSDKDFIHDLFDLGEIAELVEE